MTMKIVLSKKTEKELPPFKITQLVPVRKGQQGKFMAEFRGHEGQTIGGKKVMAMANTSEGAKQELIRAWPRGPVKQNFGMPRIGKLPKRAKEYGGLVAITAIGFAALLGFFVVNDQFNHSHREATGFSKHK